MVFGLFLRKKIILFPIINLMIFIENRNGLYYYAKMMKKYRPLKAGVIAGVTFVHVGLIALAWEAVKPQEPVVVEHLTMVDLGALGSAAPPPPSVEEVVQKVAEMPEKPKLEAPKIKAVERNDKPADLKKEVKPEPVKKNVHSKPDKPEVKPKEKVDPPKPTEQAPRADTNKQAETPKVENTKPAVNSSSQGQADGQVDGEAGGKAGGQAGAKGNGSGKGKSGSGEGAGGGSGAGAGGSTVNGGYITRPAPKYPQLSLENGEEGKVEIIITVEPNGSVSSATFARRSGFRRLDNAAMAAVKGAKYQPHVVNGQAVRTQFTVGINFKLS